jgi:pyruvate formate lyase activating enzyme
MDMLHEVPLIVDIKRHSLEDGPGIRTVVFFKGCPMRCDFCQNPETQNINAEIAFSAAACIGCRACETICPENAIDLNLPGRIRRNICTGCGRCTDACPGNGLRRIGKQYSVDEIVEIVLRDMAYYRHSGGGVTLSGGECTMHAAFLESLLAKLRKADLHVILETSGFFDYTTFSKSILPFIDGIYFDIKILDHENHQNHTGRPNRMILENFKRLLLETPEKVFPRVPLVPGVTDTEENLQAIVDFLHESGARRPVLLPYNPAGLEMYDKIGKPRPESAGSFMKIEEEIRINHYVDDYVKTRSTF